MTRSVILRSAIRSLLAVGVFAAASGAAMAAPNCTVEIEGNDAMQFNLKNIDVSKACKDFTVKLKHSGKLPKAAMGHNWVLTKTADVQAVAADGIPHVLREEAHRHRQLHFLLLFPWPLRHHEGHVEAGELSGPHSPFHPRPHLRPFFHPFVPG